MLTPEVRWQGGGFAAVRTSLEPRAAYSRRVLGVRPVGTGQTT